MQKLSGREIVMLQLVFSLAACGGKVAEGEDAGVGGSGLGGGAGTTGGAHSTGTGSSGSRTGGSSSVGTQAPSCDVIPVAAASLLGCRGAGVCAEQQCSSMVAKCFGPNYARGQYSGDCADYANCVKACNCSSGCSCQWSNSCYNCMQNAVLGCYATSSCSSATC